MASVALIAWNAEEAERQTASLRALGHTVIPYSTVSSATLRELRALAPHALIIDLNRRPSTGLQLGLAIRKVPIVFIAGDPEKTAKARDKLPSAAFTTWKKLPALLKRVHSLVPSPSSGSPMDVYKDTPVTTKLGLDKVRTIVAIDAPREFHHLLPAHIEIVEEHEHADATFCFAHTPDALQARIEQLAVRAPVWIAWPKRTGRAASPISMYSVRDIAFSAGLVDYKICGIGKQWSAMLFTHRKQKRK